MLTAFVRFLDLAFLRKKRKELVAYWSFSAQSYCLKRNIKYITWFWCSKQTRYFKNVFIIWRFIHFHDSLNIVLIVDSSCEYLCAKCVQFSLMINHINFKGHLNSVLFCKWNKICHICTCPAWFYFALPDCAHFYNKIEKFQL